MPSDLKIEDLKSSWNENRVLTIEAPLPKLADAPAAEAHAAESPAAEAPAAKAPAAAVSDVKEIKIEHLHEGQTKKVEAKWVT